MFGTGGRVTMAQGGGHYDVSASPPVLEGDHLGMTAGAVTDRVQGFLLK